MQKFIRTILKVFFILGLIVLTLLLLTLGAIWGYQKYKHHQESKLLQQLPHDDVLAKNNFSEEHLDVKIGNNKMTIQEKLDAGLNPYVEDTSGNGISDWDAIHTYDLDPTKFSTADDGISDFAKIEEGLDPKEAIDPDDIDHFILDDDDLDIHIHTNDLNAKYHTEIKEYEQDELETLYKPVRQPVQVTDYEGEIELDIPDSTSNIDELEAYYFNTETEELQKINKQHIEDHSIFATVDESYPIYVVEPEVIDSMDEYYYFRISLPWLSSAIAGYDHRILLYKRGLFTDKEFVDEFVEDIDYGIIQFSHASISKIHSLFLDAVFKVLDVIFTPIDEQGQGINIMARAIFDYGKFTGTPEYAKRYTMPWLYEHEEKETENDWSSKVVDSGFRTKVHAFPFANFTTDVADGGVCAGIARTAEVVYNGEELESEMDYKPSHWTFKLTGKSKGINELSYDLTDTINDYQFLNDGALFDYTLTDPTIEHIGQGDQNMEEDITPDQLEQPDQSLIKMLETQWIYSNDIKKGAKPKQNTNVNILDKIEDLLADEQVIYASLHGDNAGHAVTVYKMEYDKYDEDHIRLYVYDSNLPKAMLKKFGTDEAYMDIYVKEKDLMLGGTESYFEFDYTPLKEHRSDYSYSNVKGDNVLNFYHIDDPISGD